MCGLVDIFTDISEERAASIFRVEEGTPRRGKHLPDYMTSHFRRQYIHPRESLKSYTTVILVNDKAKVILYVTSSRPAPGSTQLPIQSGLSLTPLTIIEMPTGNWILGCKWTGARSCPLTSFKCRV
jgi:hypothetical protein